jgi:hypothetical protein
MIWVWDFKWVFYKEVPFPYSLHFKPFEAVPVWGWELRCLI